MPAPVDRPTLFEALQDVVRLQAEGHAPPASTVALLKAIALTMAESDRRLMANEVEHHLPDLTPYARELLRIGILALGAL